MKNSKRGEFLGRLMREAGMTLDELGAKINRDRSTVHRYIKKGDPFPPEILLILTELFGVTERELLEGKRNQPSYPIKDDELNSLAMETPERLRRYIKMLEDAVDAKDQKIQELEFEIAKKVPDHRAG